MCGIFAFFKQYHKEFDCSKKFKDELKILTEYNVSRRNSEIEHRGPDRRISKVIENDDDGFVFFDFHRLSINDLSNDGDQPMKLGNIHLMVNGEIYNYKELHGHIINKGSYLNRIIQKKFNLNKTPVYNGKYKSKSDCEIILHLYNYLVKQLKIDTDESVKFLFSLLDGVFATVIYDLDTNKITVGRDPYGVRPMYYHFGDMGTLELCSELKGMTCENDYKNNTKPCYQMPPHSYAIIDFNDLYNLYEEEFIDKIFNEYDRIEYYSVYNYENILTKSSYDDAMEKIKFLLEKAVDKRLMSDRPIGCLLSGGLDSSLVTSIVVRKLGERDIKPENINTFSIGLKGSPDLKYARTVAEHLGTKHHEVLMTIEEMIESVPETIRTVESYDVTTVRASTPNRLLAKYIKENTDITVIFSGEGADELFGGYLYFHNAPTSEDYQLETYRRMENLYMYDVQRCDRTTASQSLEVRVPFLDKDLTSYVMSLDAMHKRPNELQNIEKHILRNAFSDDNHEEGKFIPDGVLFRMKDAFSDAVGYNWVDELKKYCEKYYENQDIEKLMDKYDINKPDTTEALYFRETFHTYYNNDKILKEIWRPLWTDITDPSAKYLDEHKKE